MELRPVSPTSLPSESLPQLLRPREVAERLGVSRAYAYRLIYEGQLPAVRIGRAVRVDASELAKFVGSRPAA